MSNRNCFISGIFRLALAAAAIVSLMLASASVARSEDRIFEMRKYTAHEGKLADLHKRFRDHTNYLFVKHGMSLIGYWTPVEGPEAANTLIYILAYPSREAREASWKAFMNDPEWKKAFEESHKNGVLVAKVEATFMTPTDYSPTH
jgi:hypothetical protein